MRFSTTEGVDSFLAYKLLRELILNKALGTWPVKLLKLKSLEEKRKEKHKPKARKYQKVLKQFLYKYNLQLLQRL